MDDNYVPKMRVNAAILPEYNGQGVVILGRVQQVDPNGTTITIKSSDGVSVTIVFDQPIMENLEGIIEIHGMCHGSQVRCQSYFLHPLDQSENFDMEGYDEAVKLIHSTENPLKMAL